MPTSLRVLFVEDSDDDAALQVRLLRQADFDVTFARVDNRQSLGEALGQKWDLVISDYSMPDFSGTEALRIVRDKGLDIPFIFVSGTIGEDTAVSALKNGAQDYLMKSNFRRLIPAVHRELREIEDRRQRRRLEFQVHQLQRFEAIGRLAGGIAHDFNNVIGAIMGWAEMGCDDISPEKARERFQKIRSQAERAASLTRQLLAFARRQILQPCNTNLNNVVREEINLLKNVIGERIVIDMHLDQNARAVWADPSQIEQIIMNLCLNARDAMPEGGKLSIHTKNVEVTEEHHRRSAYALPGSYVELTVTDNGSGIDAETMEHIFEPFFTTKEMGKGTGLGLATVYGIVKQHKGFIDVESAPGRGTAFRVFLPVGQGEVKAQDKSADLPLKGGAERILIAEDNEDLRDTTRLILENLGYQVFTAATGEEAMHTFEQAKPPIDLALLDVVLPVINGPDVYQKMSAIRPDLPVIFTTGYAPESNLMAVRSGGNAAAILQKPYGSKHLAQKIRETLDRTSK